MIRIISNYVVKVPVELSNDVSIGQIVQMETSNNQVYAVLSDGSAPLGFVTAITVSYAAGVYTKEAEVSFARGYLETHESYDVHDNYPVNANLYVNNGKLTTTRWNSNYPAIGMVIQPPSALDPTLKMVWF